MFVVLSRFVVANGKSSDVAAAFRARPHLVDRAPGFLRMEVLSPREDPNEFWLLTWWTTQEHFEAWHRSHEYHESHKGIPKGLKLVPKSAQILRFDHIAS
jgi:heme-degrading monooxygenase HmoA